MKNLSFSNTNANSAPLPSALTSSTSANISSATTKSSNSNKSQRTIQVKIGNQAAKSMTPDQAADYLKSIAASTNGFFTSSGGSVSSSSGAFHREVKMTFDNGTTSTVALPRLMANASGTNTSSSTCTVNKNSILPVNSLSGNTNNATSLLFNGTVRSNSNSIGNATTPTRADGMPCSEKEMKALMSMFVEIMGLQMNTERLNQFSSSFQNHKTKTKKSSLTSINAPLNSSQYDENITGTSLSKHTAQDTTTSAIAQAAIESLPLNTATLKLQQVKKMNKKISSSGGSSSCLKITTTQKIGPNEVITATMSTSLPSNHNKDTSLFQFPTDLPPPPGGWPEDLLWPDKNNPNKRHKFIIRNNSTKDNKDDSYCVVSDVDDDDMDDDHHGGKEGETVVVITTTTCGEDDNYDENEDNDDDDDDEEEDDDDDCDDDEDDTDDDDDEHNDSDIDMDGADIESVDSLPALEAIPDNERPAFRVWQQQQRLVVQNHKQQVLALQKRHERKMMLSSESYMCDDDDDDITLSDDKIDDGTDLNLVVTGSAGIVPFEWFALERAAMEDALEQEERIRKETSKKQLQHLNGGRHGNNKFRNHNNNPANNTNNVGNVASSSSNSIDSYGFNDSHNPNHSSIQNSRMNDYYNQTRFNQQQQQVEYHAFKAKVDAANKKLGKAVAAWRNRVSTACQSNEPVKLQQFLQGSAVPFHASNITQDAGTNTVMTKNNKNAAKSKNSSKNNASGNSDKEVTRKTVDPAMDGITVMSEEDRLVQQQFLHPHLELLVPYCVPKSRNASIMNKGRQCREMLTSFLLKQSDGLYFLVQPVLKAGASSNSIIFGRSALDTSCFFGDHTIVQLMLPDILKQYEDDQRVLQDAEREKGLSGSNEFVSSSCLNFLHQTCQDSGWTPLHYAAISGSLHTVELLLQCDYEMNYDKPATYSNKRFQLLPIVYLESNDTLTWRKSNNLQQSGNSTTTSNAGSKNNNGTISNPFPGRSGGVSARELVEIVKNGMYTKDIESHGMALEEIIDFYHLDDSSNKGNNKNESTSTPLEKLQYLTSLNVIYDRLLDCEKNGFHVWDEATVDNELKKALELITTGTSCGATVTCEQQPDVEKLSALSSTDSIVEINTTGIHQGGLGGGETSVTPSISSNHTGKPASSSSASNTKKKKSKKGGGPQQASTSVDGVAVVSKELPAERSVPTENSVTSSHTDDPVVNALLGMGFAKDQIMQGVKACGGLDRATVDDVVAWIFGGNEPESVTPVAPLPPARVSHQEVHKGPTFGGKVFPESNKGNGKKTSQAMTEEERVAAQQKLALKREEQRQRNREWNNRAQARQLQEDHEKLTKAAAVEVQSPSGIASFSVGARQQQQQNLRTGLLNSIPLSTGLMSGQPNVSTIGTGTTGFVHSGTAITTTTAPSFKGRKSSIGASGRQQQVTPIEILTRNGIKSGGKLGSGKALQPSSQLAVATHAVAAATNANQVLTGGAELENMYSNDTSSVASSADYSSLKFPPMMRSNIIEVSNNNDDATVSTIGSTPAIIVQPFPTMQAPSLPSSTYYAPPGFDHGNMVVNHSYGVTQRQMLPTNYDNDPITIAASATRQQWGDVDDMGTSYRMSDLNLSAPAYIPPSTLKTYSHHQQFEHHQQNVSTLAYNDCHQVNISGVANSHLNSHHRLPMASMSHSSSGGGDPFNVGPSAVAPTVQLSSFGSGDRSGAFSNNGHGYLAGPQHQHASVGMSTQDRDQHRMESDLLAGAFGGMSLSKAVNDVDYRISRNGPDPLSSVTSNVPVVPGLNFESFGRSDMGPRYEPLLESSLIESISTGASALSWGNNQTNRSKSTGSSLLLGSVINPRNQIDDSFVSPNSYDHLLPPYATNNNNLGISNVSDSASDSLNALGNVLTQQHHHSNLGSLNGMGMVRGEPALSHQHVIGDTLEPWLGGENNTNNRMAAGSSVGHRSIDNNTGAMGGASASGNGNGHSIW